METLKSIIIWIITAEAKLVLRKYKPKVVAVTGNVGKTSTKDAIYAVLAVDRFTRKSDKSFNSEIGVPLTILGCPNAWKNPFSWIQNIFRGLMLILLKEEYPEWLVLEVGADRPGDISRLASWLKPHISVLTALPKVPVHVEYFKSPALVRHEKKSLLRHTRADGILVLNKDDAAIVRMANEFHQPVLWYGTIGGCDMRGSHPRILYEDKKMAGYVFRVNHGKESFSLEMRGAIGRQLQYPALAAASVGELVGLSFEQIEAGLRSFSPPPGRARLLPAIKGAYIIDDSYNASPAADHEALRALGEVKTSGKKIAVLGDMLELGTYSSDAHTEVGKHAAEVCDLLLTVGIRARGIAAAALAAGMHESAILQYENSERAGKELEAKLGEGDVVLIKGSQGMRMERAVKEIMAEPERAAELLVRQDAEWLKR